jgi:hypothetical protein
MSETEPIEVVDEHVLVGPAASLRDLPKAEDAAVEELSRRLADQAVAVPGDRSALNYALGLLRRLRQREMVRDLGEHEARIDWLDFHVPPGGKGRLVLGRTATGEGGIDLKLMGLGFGSGIEMKTAAERDFGEREQCFSMGSLLRIHLREFAEQGGRSSVQVDVVKRIGNYIESHKLCPRCFAAAAAGPQPRRLDETWDLSGDPEGLTEKRSYDLTHSSEVEVGLDLPVLATAKLNAGIAISRSVQSTCEATYVLRGGARFSAWQDLVPGLGLPFWGRE